MGLMNLSCVGAISLSQNVYIGIHYTSPSTHIIYLFHYRILFHAIMDLDSAE